MPECYKPGDLDRFGEVGRNKPELFRKFMDWYASAMQPGALTAREKALIGLGVAHAVQCPYCIEAYTKACLEQGMTLDHMTEAVHAASAVRGGAALVHMLQARDTVEGLSL